MNDWLDYKGSGSSRAYMGDTISHGLFGIRTKADVEAEQKQRDADMRLYNALDEKRSSIQKRLNTLMYKYNNYQKEINSRKNAIPTYTNGLDYNRNELNDLEAKRAAAVKTVGSLAASQKYAASIYKAQEQVKSFTEHIKKANDYIAVTTKKQAVIMTEVDKLNSELNELESRMSVLKQTFK